MKERICGEKGWRIADDIHRIFMTSFYFFPLFVQSQGPSFSTLSVHGSIRATLQLGMRENICKLSLLGGAFGLFWNWKGWDAAILESRSDTFYGISDIPFAAIHKKNLVFTYCHDLLFTLDYMKHSPDARTLLLLLSRQFSKPDRGGRLQDTRCVWHRSVDRWVRDKSRAQR